MKLKNLEEINEAFHQDKGYHIFVPEAIKLLKQEVIKHVKELRKRIYRLKHPTKKEIKNLLGCTNDYQVALIQSKIDWIKKFFNINLKRI